MLQLSEHDLFRCLVGILRHDIYCHFDVSMDENGWVDINQLAKSLNENEDFAKVLGIQNGGEKSSVSGKDIIRIVSENDVDDKKLISFNHTGTKIRANSGHTLPILLNSTKFKPPQVLYYYVKNSETPEKFDISPKKNEPFVYLTDEISSAIDKGISLCVSTRLAKRDLLIIYINSGEMYNDGYEFYLCKNKFTWMTKFIPAKYIFMKHLGIDNVPRFSGSTMFVNNKIVGNLENNEVIL